MEGISDEWTDIGNRKFVPFSALQPGEYTFKVRGSNNDGVWNNKEISVRIKILPPWWKSTLAFVLYFILIILSIIAFIKGRERKLKREQKILEQKVLERTIQIEEQAQLISSKNQELNELNRTKDKFFSIIGHDLGNQFNISVCFSELLVSGIKKVEAGKLEYHLTNIYNASKHAHDLLENLLTWAKMQTKGIQFNPEQVRLYDRIYDTIELFEAAAERKNIQIVVSGNEELVVFADVNMLTTIMRNLVSNAIKFTPVNGTIQICFQEKGEFCEISVSDCGVGITQDNIGKIFRIDSNHTTLGTSGEKGTGLGLVLCKEFVEKHGGKIQVESQVGKGSNFLFTLPLRAEMMS